MATQSSSSSPPLEPKPDQKAPEPSEKHDQAQTELGETAPKPVERTFTTPAGQAVTVVEHPDPTAVDAPKVLNQPAAPPSEPQPPVAIPPVVPEPPAAVPVVDKKEEVTVPATTAQPLAPAAVILEKAVEAAAPKTAVEPTAPVAVVEKKDEAQPTTPVTGVEKKNETAVLATATQPTAPNAAAEEKAELVAPAIAIQPATPLSTPEKKLEVVPPGSAISAPSPIVAIDKKVEYWSPKTVPKASAPVVVKEEKKAADTTPAAIAQIPTAIPTREKTPTSTPPATPAPKAATIHNVPTSTIDKKWTLKKAATTADMHNAASETLSLERPIGLFPEHLAQSETVLHIHRKKGRYHDFTFSEEDGNDVFLVKGEYWTMSGRKHVVDAKSGQLIYDLRRPRIFSRRNWYLETHGERRIALIARVGFTGRHIHFINVIRPSIPGQIVNLYVPASGLKVYVGASDVAPVAMVFENDKIRVAKGMDLGVAISLAVTERRAVL